MVTPVVKSSLLDSFFHSNKQKSSRLKEGHNDLSEEETQAFTAESE